MTMESAYDFAAKAVLRRLELQCPERHDAIRKLTKTDVGVFEGTYDSVQEVLRRLGIPFSINPNQKALSKCAIAFANCSSSCHQNLSGGQAERFVQDGGWLISSDWSLANVVQKQFPGKIGRSKGRHTGDEVVSVEPTNQSLWAEVAVPGADPQCWVESSSYPIEVLDSDNVSIEAASCELFRKYDAPVAAARFDWGGGHVYHVISHFWLKRTRQPGSSRYSGPAKLFLDLGLKLEPGEVDRLSNQFGSRFSKMNFATFQSAATSTELIAQLCVEAVMHTVS